jgi:GAF domain-containing protein
MTTSLSTPQTTSQDTTQTKVWQETVFNRISKAIGIAGSLLFVIYMVVSYKITTPSLALAYTAAYLLVMTVAFVQRIPMRYRVAMFALMIFTLGVIATLEKAAIGDGRVWLILSVVFAVAFLGQEAGLFFTAIATLTWGFIGYLFVTSTIPQPRTEQFTFAIWAGTTLTLFGVALVTVLTVSALFHSLNKNIEKSNALAKRSEEQAEQVERQRHALERRSNALEASAKISRQLASFTTRQEILEEITKLLRAYYAINSAAVFILEDEQELRLASSNGWNEQAHPSRDYSLSLNEDIVGLAVLKEKAFSNRTTDVTLEAKLPETQAYVAIPLRGRTEIFGALLLQSEDSSAFGQEGLNIFQMLADQTAVLLENADLLVQRENALEAERRAYGEITQAAWNDFLKSEGYSGYRRDKKGLTLIEEEAYTTQEKSEQSVRVPIKIRNKVIGYIDARKPKNRAWTVSEKELLDILTSRLETSLDSARLNQDSQQKARREQIIAETSQHVRESLDIEGVLEAAARELRRNLDIEKAEVWINAEQLDVDLSEEQE